MKKGELTCFGIGADDGERNKKRAPSPKPALLGLEGMWGAGGQWCRGSPRSPGLTRRGFERGLVPAPERPPFGNGKGGTAR